MQAEHELLLRCVSVANSHENAESIQCLAVGEIDWHHLLRLARQHQVAPLLYKTLSRSCGEIIPAIVAQTLCGLFRDNAVRNLLLCRELLRVLDGLKRHGVLTLPFKGPILAITAYRDLSLRQFGDLDILVQEHDFTTAKRLLLADGYRLGWQPEDECAYVKTHNHLAFVKDQEGIVLDLQWRFAKKEFRFPMDLTSLWGRLEQQFFGKTVVYHPAPEDLLLILCGHGAKHCWSRLNWISDIAAFVSVYQDRIDWDCVLSRASAMGGKRMLLLGLCVARDLLDSSLPKCISQEIGADNKVLPLSRQVMVKLFWEPNKLPQGPFDRFQQAYGGFGFAQRSRFYLKSRERLRDKLPYLWHISRILTYRCLVPSDLDRSVLSLPAGLSFLYYFIRPLRLLVKHGTRLWRHLNSYKQAV